MSLFALGSGGPAPPPLTDEELKKLVSEELIRESGVDFESRNLLAFYSCYLPDPRTADYDVLLDRLDQFVENDYAIVLFASGLKHQPSWAWIFKAYQRLSRKYRKNLKNLYIVHPSIFAKVLLQMMGTIISANEKFDHPVPEPAPAAPPSALLKVQTNAPPKKVPGAMFGLTLDELMGPDGSKGIPVVVKECVECLRATGLECEGIFRRSPSSQLMNAAKEAFDKGESNFDFENKGGVHLAAVLLKLFFRELPKPIIESDMYDIFRRIESLEDRNAQINFIKTTIFPLLTLNELLLLRFVFELLSEVHAKSEKNLMNSHNLTIIWGPNLIRGGSPVLDMAMCTVGSGGGGVGTTVKLMIEDYSTVFRDIIDSLAQPPPTLLPSYESNLEPSLTARPRKMAAQNNNRNSVSADQDPAMDAITRSLADNRIAAASKRAASPAPK
ncbi:hypothetical protein HDU96_006490 [Phlyctochytrium bullatum]|nr:hypothetical protein HDU96_006490 [Phlyctochytrium bullatum]